VTLKTRRRRKGRRRRRNKQRQENIRKDLNSERINNQLAMLIIDEEIPRNIKEADKSNSWKY